MPGIQCLKGHGMNALCVVGTICLEYNATCLNCCCDWTTTPGMCRTKRCARNVTIGPAMLRSLRKQARRQASMIPRQGNQASQEAKPGNEAKASLCRERNGRNRNSGTQHLEYDSCGSRSLKKKKQNPSLNENWDMIHKPPSAPAPDLPFEWNLF